MVEPQSDLEDLFENGAVGLHFVGPDGTILRANRAELELLGYPREEYIGRNIREFHADEAVIGDILQRLGRGEQLDKYPARLTAKDGSLRHVLITSSARFADGKFLHTRCFTIDVTAQQQVENKSRRDREVLQAIVETTPECVKIVERDCRVAYMNAAGLRLAEAAAAEDVVGTSVLDLIAPEDRETWRLAHARVCQGEKLSWEFDIVGRHGARRHMETHAAPIPMPDGAYAQLAVTRDVTERHRQQQRLADSERHLRALLQALPAAVYTTDADGRIDFYNQAAIDLAGRHPQLGEQWCISWKLYRSDGTPMPHAECPMAVALREGRPVRGAEIVVERPDGARAVVAPYPTPLHDPAGRLVGGINMLVDITERKAAEAALRASEERLGRILDLTPLGIAEIAPSGRILYANASAQRILRLSRSQVEGRRYDAPDWTVTTPDGVPVPIDETPPARALRGEAVSNCEVAVVGPDGFRVIIAVNAMLLRERDARPSAALVAFTDVTARHDAEAALRDSEERFRTLANNIAQLAWMANPDGWIFWYNQRWYDYTGTTPEQMEGWGWEAVHDPAALPEVLARWRQSLARGEAFDMVFPLRGADAVYRPFLTRVAPVRNASGEVVRWFGTNTDISEQRRIEQALRASETELQRLNDTLEQRVRTEVAAREQAQTALFQAQKLEAIGQLTGGVAHDFNNLLTAVIGNLEILVADRLSERSRRLVDAALRSAERGARLTEQLLAYGRRQHLRPQAIDVNGLVHGLDDMLRRTLGGLVHVETELSPDLWPALGDPTQLELAILNLAINARDAMPVGGTLLIQTENVRAEGGVEPGLAPGEYVHLAVGDTGTGMTPEILQKAMDPFFTTKEIGKGSGLGLSQVYGVVTQSGGTVRLESVPGEGTRVLIWLPRASGAPQQAEPAEASAARLDLRGRLLVVDDDNDVRSVAVEVLKSAGYHVEEAASGAAALAILDSGVPVDLAIVDYAMPRMSGTQFMTAARQRRPDLPVVYITGYAHPDEAADDPTAVIVKKPYRLPELLRVAQQALERTARSPARDNVVPIKPPNPAPAARH